MNGNVLDYKTIPALAKYIDRIGAEQLNFKRFMIKEHKGKYYTEKCIIKINKEGEIYCSKKEYAPSKEEKEQIKGALMAAQWPSSILATNIDGALRVSKARRDDFSVFWSRKENGIIMLQQRIAHDDGTKDYVPWSYWSDGQWRRMEPDGPLPFWKPEKRISKLIMIHEGAKAAHHMDRMINSDEPKYKKIKEQHPWADELKFYEHWGIIGGALAPHRADYSELWAEKPVEIVYVCDNDWAGKAALQEVSRHWGGSLKGIKFDNRWPPSFDLGDEFSAKTTPHLFSDTGRYIGPTLNAMMKPATWATEMQFSGDKGRPQAIVRRVFREEWLHSVKPEAFIHKDKPNKLLSASEFNSTVAPYSDVDDTARLLRKDDVSKGAVLSYEPNKKPGPYGSQEKGYYINTHVPSHIRAEKGDYEIWERFLEYLMPVEDDRTEAARWLATLIARPDIKMHYGMLLVSETQGVGKTSLGEKILKPLIGEDNVSTPSENHVVESQFNYWAAHKRLAIVSEIYAGHSSKAYDKLKAIITDRTIEVQQKYMATYTIDNWVHVLASSNSMRALKMSADDRRWFVPKVTEEKQDWSWWDKLNRWIEHDGGLSKIKYWAELFIKEHDPVKTGESAPWSSMKQEMIEEGLSPGQQLASNLFKMVKEEMNGSHFIISDMDVVELIKNKIYDGKPSDKLERPATIRKQAKANGLYVSNIRASFKKWKTLETRPKLICSSLSLTELQASELDAMDLAPLDLMAFLDKYGKM